IWLSNLVLAGDDDPLGRVGELVTAIRRRHGHTVLVTNEVGLGIVPATALGRDFRDLAGLAHQRLAAAATQIHLAVLGTVLRLRPAPIRIATGEEDGNSL